MTKTTPNDAVNHPSHYTQYPVEVIELTRHMTFNRGNAVKYVARAGYKGGPEKELEDIDKAIWYLIDERALVEKKLAEKKEASNTTGGTWDGLQVAGSINTNILKGAKG
jgi:hypothetical protein